MRDLEAAARGTFRATLPPRRPRRRRGSLLAKLFTEDHANIAVAAAMMTILALVLMVVAGGVLGALPHFCVQGGVQ